MKKIIGYVMFAAALGVGAASACAGNSPRSRTLLDFNWGWQGDKTTFVHPGAIQRWQWKPASVTRPPHRVPANILRGHRFKTVKTGADVFHGRIGFAWFQARLPAHARADQSIRFGNVDDNATVYLNGQRIKQHNGYGQAFRAPLKAGWRAGGKNILTVLVQNTAGAGGIIGQVYIPSGRPVALHPPTGSWRKVRIPNDYIVRGKFSSSADGGHGYLPTYPAWYRKTFNVPSADKHKILWLYFEGVYRDSRLFINGKFVGRHLGGYASFRYNITKFVHPGSNKLLMHVDPVKTEGWWYEGGGIYRNVWLIAVHKLHVAPYGTYVISHVPGHIAHGPSGSRAAAQLTIETTVRNNRTHAAHFVILSNVLNAAGKPVAAVRSSARLAAGSSATIKQSAHLARAALWSLHHTNLYHLRTVIKASGKAVDEKTTTFGIRTIRFDPNHGFFLNGRHVELKGECNHQDFPAVGIGAPNNLWWWRVMMLKKELHANAYRCSHNPVAPAFYRACDHLGMLVMDENRHLGDTQSAKSGMGVPYQHLRALKSMILRDRNHPSIIMWSMCNEEPLEATPYGAKVFKAMMREVHKFDRTRPITCAMNGGYPNGFTHVEDLQGINYNPGAYAWMHKLKPNMPIFGSETGSTCSDRGVISSSAKKGLVSQYSMHPPWAQQVWDAWKPIATQPFVAGGFNWTGFDYRGEPTPYGWPDINSHFGLLDICGFMKPTGYYYRAWFGHKPLVYISPQWNLPRAMRGKKVLVRCYSNCAVVKLFVNGKLISSKPMPKYMYVDWHVPYTPGKLVVQGYNHGRKAATFTQRTTGAPSALKFINQWPTLRANGEDIAPIAVSVVDAHGHVVTDATNMVRFSLTGPGKIVGAGNGDPACHQPNQAPYHRAFYGHCMVMVRARRRAGKITLTARAKGLKSATLVLRTVKTAAHLGYGKVREAGR